MTRRAATTTRDDDPFDIAGVDELYELAPAEFIAARDAIVKQLKGEGRKEAADAVKALRRPTVLGWSVNQVARSEPAMLKDLRAAGEAVRDAQAHALKGERSELRAAVQRHRKVVGDMAAKAAALAGVQYRDEAAATFEAASIDDNSFALLSQGRLTGELERDVDLAFAGMPANAPRKKAAKQPAKPSQKDAERHKRAIADAEAAIRSAEDAVRRAETRVRDAQREVKTATARLESARAELDQLRSGG
ncbi:MAG TPA: hypothetical protein VMS14_11385 [Ilumatobacteraceae bacterium]|nr:hypothetical protein [Ilumatobacteraceae bacterium]